MPTGPSGSPPAPIVKLKTWVNVVLVLILLASCSAAGNVSDIATQTSGAIVTQTSYGSQLASQDEVTDLCRLLGAVAAKQCQDAARGTSAP
jgi:hypothetical protein